MKDILVSFKVAKLAKEKGFNIKTCDFFSEKIISNLVPQGDYKYLSIDYDSSGEDISPHGFWDWNSTNKSKRLISAFNESYGEDFNEVFSAPTQSLLQRWLREKYNLEINVILDFQNIEKKLGKYYDLGIFRYKENSRELLPLFSKYDFENYEEALESGLFEALNLIN